MPNAAKLSQVMADGGGNLTVFMYDMKVRPCALICAWLHLIARAQGAGDFPVFMNCRRCAGVILHEGACAWCSCMQRYGCSACKTNSAGTTGTE
jgi:hypothetical protein